jgi:endonuclease-8
MAEGPVIHFYARQLRRVLEGKTLDITLTTRALKPYERSLEGLRVTEVEAHGKQIRIYLSDKRLILVHLMMWGSWRIYRKGAEWDKPRNRARLIVKTETHEVVAFSAPVVKIFTLHELENASDYGNLGPDPLRKDFSAKEFRQRLQKNEEREIGEVLLDQKVVAGIGNILRIEILFYAHIHPKRKIKDLSALEIDELIHWSLRLMNQWMKEMSRAKKSWVRIYRKGGHACPVCNANIQFFRQAGRITYACQGCQK